MHKIFLFGFLYLAVSAMVQAQISLEGRVTNEKGEPIEYATVLLRHPGDSVLIMGSTTNELGRYLLKDVKPNPYILQIQFVGYVTQTQIVEVTGGEVQTVPVWVLQEDSKLLKEVVVRGQKALIEQEGEKLILNVQNLITAGGSSALELLARAPGVSIDQNDQISLNGKTGVTVLIDGKVTYLPAAELASMLRGMNSDNVAQVEVIANPGARYDAAGNSGVINIKLKKNRGDGFNGVATAGAGHGRYGKANAGLNLNYRAGKWNHFLNLGYSFNRRFAIVDIDRVSMRANENVYFRQYSDRVQEFSASTWQAGSEYQWKNNSLTIGTAGSLNNRATDSETSTKIFSSEAGMADSSLWITSNQGYAWHNLTTTLGYKHRFSEAGHELLADVDYSDYRFALDDQIQVSEFDRNDVSKNQYTVLTHQPSNFSIYAARVDYTKPLNDKGAFEAGVKHSKVKTLSNVFYRNNEFGEFQEDVLRSNDFNYQEEITAGYVNLKLSIAGFNSQLGLRGEHTNYAGRSEKEDRLLDRNYFRLFPTMNISREFHTNYRAAFSYSHRIDRPAYNDLYPFVYFLDPFSGQRGNPLLRPQLTHTFQLSQTIAKDYTINLGYSRIIQYMAFVIVLQEDRVSGYATRDNLDRHENYYLSAVVPVRIGKWWSVNANVNVFYNRFDALLFGEFYKIDRLSGMANISQAFTLPFGMTGEITAVYSAPNAVGLFQNRAFGSLNVGLQRQFFEKKLAVRVNVADAMQTNFLRNTITYPGFDMRMVNRAETRIARVNITYSFGKNTSKTSRRRNAQEEEQRRINTN
jgi:hypothetical protein